MVQYFHQLRTTGARRVIIEKVELRYALAEEVTQHHPRFLVAMTVAPDFIQAFHSRIDNIARILRGGEKLHRGAVTVVGLVQGKWGCFDEC